MRARRQEHPENRRSEEEEEIVDVINEQTAVRARRQEHPENGRSEEEEEIVDVGEEIGRASRGYRLVQRTERWLFSFIAFFGCFCFDMADCFCVYVVVAFFALFFVCF